MPRTEVQLDCCIEHLSVLDEDGNLDAALEPDLSDDLLYALHRAMLRTRRFDEHMLSLQRQGRLGTFAPVRGQEASQLGAVAHLRDDDWLVPSYRDIAALLWRGAAPDHILLANAGYNEGCSIPADHNDLPIAVPVGTQMLHAAGVGYALRMQGSDRVVMTFFGDGATSEGDFHEAMNLARVFASPTIFVCENNQYAISLPRARQTRSKTLAQKGLAYDIPALQVDGNDVLAVYVAVGEAVARARETREPTLIECLTYRLAMHTTVDDPTKYRSQGEVEQWKRRDPLPRFQRYLRERDLLDDAMLESLEKEIAAELRDATRSMDRQIEDARGPETLFEHVFAELPAPLREQRRAVVQSDG